ncbi:hypothetical protein CR513_45818, partial [Mucuna pruriens]
IKWITEKETELGFFKVLNSFELVSGLKNNFLKSQLYCWLESKFLFCKLGSIPFIYLGCLLGLILKVPPLGNLQ